MSAIFNMEAFIKEADDLRDLHRNNINGLEVDQVELSTRTRNFLLKLSEFTMIVSNDTMLIGNLIEDLQRQLNFVANQSFLALEVLKRKEVTTDAEIRKMFEDLIAARMRKMSEEAQAKQALEPSNEGTVGDNDGEETGGAKIISFPTVVS